MGHPLSLTVQCLASAIGGAGDGALPAPTRHGGDREMVTGHEQQPPNKQRNTNNRPTGYRRLIFFCLVNGGVGGGVNDDVGIRLGDQCSAGGWVSLVGGGAVQRLDLNITRAAQDFRGDLTGLAEHQDLHFRPSRSC